MLMMQHLVSDWTPRLYAFNVFGETDACDQQRANGLLYSDKWPRPSFLSAQWCGSLGVCYGKDVSSSKRRICKGREIAARSSGLGLEATVSEHFAFV